MAAAPSSSTRSQRRSVAWPRRYGLTLSLLFLLGPTAQANETGDRCQRNLVCRVHSSKGIVLSERKNYAEALQEFQAAYAAEPAPRLLVNIGRSLYRLDRPQEALDYYNRYRRAETSLDSEAEQALRRYEIDALMSLASSNQVEPAPAPLQAVANPLPPRPVWGLLGASLGLFAVGIGLGAGAQVAAGELSQRMNDYPIFGPVQRGVEARGQTLQTAGIVFDVMGLVAFTAGGTMLGMWIYEKKAKK
jgi:tetratricopeptide (TPR) repeat protein